MTMYYAVFYSTDGTIHMWPGKTREECFEKLRDMLRSEKCHGRCKRTTIIHRATESEFPFGSPESLNVLPKFDKDLRNGKEEFER